MSERNQDKDNNLLDRVNQRIKQTGIWYVTWGFNDLANLSDTPMKSKGEGDEKPRFSPETVPASKMNLADKLKLVKYFLGEEMQEYVITLAQAEDGTIVQQIRIIPTGGELHFDSKSIRDAVNEAFGEADDKICEQEGLFSDHLKTNDVYTPNDLCYFCNELEQSLGYAFSEVPEDVRFLAEISDWDCISRQGLQRITASPWAMAMTYLPEHVKKYDKKCDDNEAKELHQKHRQIIVGALLNMQPEEFLCETKEGYKATRDAWNSRTKLQFNDEEIDALLPKPSIKRFMASAKALGDDYRNEAVRAFELYSEIRDAYKGVLKHVDLQEFFGKPASR